VTPGRQSDIGANTSRSLEARLAARTLLMIKTASEMVPKMKQIIGLRTFSLVENDLHNSKLHNRARKQRSEALQMRLDYIPA
jgi:hypothetical protein